MVCNYCKLEMLTADGCVVDAVIIGGVAYDPVPYGNDGGWRRRPKGRCHDCGALPGRVHHHGCDIEICPNCRRQSIMCACL